MERVNSYDKLYLEFGGKLSGDLHAMRVLPGFDANAKIKVLHQMRDKAEVIICVYASDIENSKIRGDYDPQTTEDLKRTKEQIDQAKEVLSNPERTTFKMVVISRIRTRSMSASFSSAVISDRPLRSPPGSILRKAN